MDQLTTQQASEILAVTPQRILALIKNGRLPAIKFGRDWLIAMQDLEKFEKRPQGNYKLTADKVKEISNDLCAAKGATMEGNRAARDAAGKAVIEFLGRTFGS